MKELLKKYRASFVTGCIFSSVLIFVLGHFYLDASMVGSEGNIATMRTISYELAAIFFLIGLGILFKRFE